MTCVVGVVGPKGQMVFGGDSLVTVGDSAAQLSGETKVWKSGPYLFGAAGASRGAQIARYAFKAPAPKGRDLDAFMATTFANALRDQMRDLGHAEKLNNVETFGGELLIGVRGVLYMLYGDYDFDRLREDFAAIGCGARPALGALYATKSMGATKQRVLTALAAAEAFDANVRRPFVVITSEGGTQ